MKWKFPQTRLRNLTPPSPTLPPVGGKEGGGERAEEEEEEEETVPAVCLRHSKMVLMV